MAKRNLPAKCAIVGFIFLLFFIPYWGLYQNFQHVPADRYYFGSVDNAIDVVGNLDTVRQGYLGKWMRTPNKTTALQGKATYVKIEYILIGQAARLLHIDPVLAYFIFRAIISVSGVVAILLIVAQVVPTWWGRAIALLFVFFGTGITESWHTWPTRIMDSLPGDTLVFQRLTTAAPHYLLGILFPLLSMYFLSRNRIFLALILGFLGTFVYSPSMLLVVGSVWLLFLKNQKIRPALILYSIVSISPMLYMQYVSRYWDLNLFGKTEFIVPFRLQLGQYIFVVAVPYVLSIFSIPEILKKKDPLLLLFLPWIIMHPVFTLVISQILAINPSRFFFGPYFVIFGILAYFGMKRMHKGIVVALISFMLIASFISYGASLNYTKTCFCLVQYFDYGYPNKNLMQAIFWLRDHTKAEDIVLSGSYAGVLIPSFAGNRVYTSWWLRIMDEELFAKLEEESMQFYSGSMDALKAYEFLNKNAIEYIILSEQEKMKNGLHYPSVRAVATFGDVQVYQVDTL